MQQMWEPLTGERILIKHDLKPWSPSYIKVSLHKA